MLGLLPLAMVLPMLRLLQEESAAAAFVRLLGARATFAPITTPYCHTSLICNDKNFLEARLEALLRQNGPAPVTMQEAVVLQQQMVIADYAQGQLLQVNGWLLPESVVLTAVYARLNPA